VGRGRKVATRGRSLARRTITFAAWKREGKAWPVPACSSVGMDWGRTAKRSGAFANWAIGLTCLSAGPGRTGCGASSWNWPGGAGTAVRCGRNGSGDRISVGKDSPIPNCGRGT